MKWLLATLVLLLAAVALGAAWLLGTESGLHWAAARARSAAESKLSLDGLRGTLASGIEFGAIRFRDGGTEVRLSNGELRLELLGLLAGRAGLRDLRAEELEIRTAKKGAEPPSQPPTLPLGVRIDRAEIARIRFRELTVEDFELTDAVLAEHGAISGRAAFVIRTAAFPVRIGLQIGGTLERIDAAAEGSVADIPFTARALVSPFAGRALQSITARAGPADLRRLQPEWPSTALTAQMSGAAAADSPLAGTLSLSNARPGPLEDQRLPVSTLHARFTTDFSSLFLRELRVELSAPAPAGTLNGTADITAERARLDLRAADLDLQAFRRTLRKTSLSGPLTIVASKESQAVQGTLSQDGMSLSADALRTGDVVEIRRLRALAEGGEATGSGRLRLGQPVRFDAKLRLARFDPARFGDYPQGSINGTLEATGVLDADYSADARWGVEDSRLHGETFASSGVAHVSRRRVSRLSAQATFGQARLSAKGSFGRSGDELAVQVEVPDLGQLAEGFAGRLTAGGRLAGTWDSPQGSVHAQAAGLALPSGLLLASVTAKASGASAKHDAQIAFRGEGLDAVARLRGGWRPGAGWTGDLYALRNAGDYPLRLAQPASLHIAPDRVELGRLEATLGDGELLVKHLDWSPSRISTSGQFTALPAQWLILAGGLIDRVRASLRLDGQWNLAGAPAELDGSLSLRRSSGDVTLLDAGEVTLGVEKASVDARLNGGAMSATGSVASRFGTAELQAKLDGFGPESGLTFTARMRFAELRALLQPFLDGPRVDGRLAAELRGSGTLAQVNVTGSVQGDGLALQIPPYGVYLKDGELRAVLEGDRLRITRFSVHGGEGLLTASGVLPLRTAAEGGATLQWQAQSFRLLERPDLRLVVSGAGEAKLVRGKVSLSGALRADRGYLELEQDRLPQLGDDVVVAGSQREAAKGTARVPVALDLQLDLGERLEVRGYGLEGRLAGRLQVETTEDGELRAYGRIHTVNATFLAYGQRLQVDPGVAIFDGPLDNPSLQLTAWRRNQQVEAGVQVSGTALAPRVQLVSQPLVPEGERLSWLVLGRAPGEASKADLGLLQAAAGALLARGDRLPLDRRIARAFGVDEISLRGSGEVGDRVVAVGKRLSDRLYVSYEQGLGVVASALVKLDLALTQRLSVRAETGTSSGVGLFYRFSWD